MTDDEVFDRLLLILYPWLHCLWKCTTVGVPVSLKRVKTAADERYCLWLPLLFLGMEVRHERQFRFMPST